MKILTMSGRIPDMEEELKKIQEQKQEYITHNDLKENEVITFHLVPTSVMVTIAHSAHTCRKDGTNGGTGVFSGCYYHFNIR